MLQVGQSERSRLDEVVTQFRGQVSKLEATVQALSAEINKVHIQHLFSYSLDTRKYVFHAYRVANDLSGQCNHSSSTG
jgi:hypothetical protein